MGIMADFMRELEDDNEIKILTNEEKLQKLDISDNDFKMLKKLPFSETDYVIGDDISYEVETINLVDLVGLNRNDDVNNWAECLLNLHKQYMYDRFKSKELFSKLLMNPGKAGHPKVIKKDKKYYIDGEGKHRLTIAKCIGIPKAKVLVANYK